MEKLPIRRQTLNDCINDTRIGKREFFPYLYIYGMNDVTTKGV